MWSIVWGVILIVAALSGDFVLRGTEGETGRILLGVAGGGILLYGIYRVGNPRVTCRLCYQEMPKNRFEAHVREQHPELLGGPPTPPASATGF